MTLTDEELRRRLADRARAAPTTTLADVARAMATSPQARSGPRIARVGVLGSLAASIIVGVALVGGLFLRTVPPAAGPSGNPAGSGSTTTDVTSPGALTSPGVTPTQVPALAWTAIEWRRLSSTAFPLPSLTIVNDAVTFGDGFVAVGTSRTKVGPVARIWRSTDGTAWDQIDADFVVGLDVQRIMAVGDRLVLFGNRRDRADSRTIGSEVWWSRDGASWQEGPSTPVVLQSALIAAGSLGILARDGAETFVLDPDLATWSQVTAKWPDDVRLGPVAGGDGIWIQPGATGIRKGSGGVSAGAIWTSTDGRTWEPAVVDDPAGFVMEAHRVARGYVAIGSTADVSCRVCFGQIVVARVAWFSADGSHWARIAGSVSGEDDRFFGASFAGDGQRLLAFGQEYPKDTGSGPPVPAIFETIEGRIWTPIEIRSSPSLPFQLDDGLTIGRHGVIELPGGIPDATTGAVAWWGQAVEAP